MIICAKTQFESLKKANSRCKQIANIGKNLYPYKCKTCDKWHLTSTSKKDYHTKQRFLASESEYWTRKLGLDTA